MKSDKKDGFGSENGSEGKDWVRTAVRKWKRGKWEKKGGKKVFEIAKGTLGRREKTDK